MNGSIGRRVARERSGALRLRGDEPARMSDTPVLARARVKCQKDDVGVTNVERLGRKRVGAITDTRDGIGSWGFGGINLGKQSALVGRLKPPCYCIDSENIVTEPP